MSYHPAPTVNYAASSHEVVPFIIKILVHNRPIKLKLIIQLSKPLAWHHQLLVKFNLLYA